MIEKDLVILGAGPVGLFAGFYAGMRSIDTLIIDQLSFPGGQLAALYPEKFIYDIAGFEKIKAKALITNLLNQISRFNEKIEIKLDTKLENIEKENDIFIIKTNNNLIKTKSIILAAGNGGFSPRKLGLENEELFKNIDYSINDFSKYNKKKIAIFGGGDSAVDFALMLEKEAKEVHIIHRRNEFRAHDHSVKQLNESSVTIHTPFTPKELKGNNNLINSIIIESKDNEQKELDIDYIICNYGFITDLSPLNTIGLTFNKRKITVNSNKSTNIEGIYAIGDICSYPGKANLIATGFGEAPIAINEVYQYLNPDKIFREIHSSNIIEEE